MGHFQRGGGDTEGEEVWRGTSVEVLRANKGISLKGTEAYVCCIKRGSPVSAVTCLVQAAGQGEPGIMGKRRRSNAKESMKIVPDFLGLLGQMQSCYQFCSLERIQILS